jgi:GNAT superfamily N-acetyltransferase
LPDTFLEIVDPTDPLVDSFWLPLYRSAFAEDERVPEEENRGAAAAPDEHILVGLHDGQPVSMARYDVVAESDAGPYAYLMYMAVSERAVSRGHGQQMFSEIVRRATEDPITPVLLVFEVQRPDHSTAVEPHQLADRRIDFYRRQGAYVLEGVDYIQHVPGQPGVPMLIMARPIATRVTPEVVLMASKDMFGNDVTVLRMPSLI